MTFLVHCVTICSASGLFDEVASDRFLGQRSCPRSAQSVQSKHFFWMKESSTLLQHYIKSQIFISSPAVYSGASPCSKTPSRSDTTSCAEESLGQPGQGCASRASTCRSSHEAGGRASQMWTLWGRAIPLNRWETNLGSP